ncbi:hypothetical protein ACFQH6_14245 [Halobacteriaceae archaeon GCM10025711]
MTHLQFTDRDEWMARRYDYGDSVVIVADIGVDDDAVTVDVLDDTAIVVIEHDGESTQSELALPEGDAQVFMNNGILTIQIEL